MIVIDDRPEMQMAPSTQILLSFLLTFGVPLVLAIRELLAMHRRPGGGSFGEPPPAPKPYPPDEFYDRPLPACLIPKRYPEKVPEWA